MKKRSKAVTKSENTSVKVSIPGVWVALDVYHQDFEGEPEANGHVRQTIEHPVTKERFEAAFVPKRRAGYFDGEVAAVKKVKLDETVDDDLSALRSNQVNQSFEDRSHEFANALPVPAQNAYTLDELKQLRDNAPEDDTQMQAGNMRGRGGDQLVPVYCMLDLFLYKCTCDFVLSMHLIGWIGCLFA